MSAVAVNPGLVRTEILRHSNRQADIALSYIVIVCFPIWFTVSKTKYEGKVSKYKTKIRDKGDLFIL